MASAGARAAAHCRRAAAHHGFAAYSRLGLGLAGSALEGGVGGRRQGAGARRGSVEARRRRKAEAKAGRKRAFEASAARAAAVGRTAVEHAAAKRAAAERARVVAAISALERRAATKWSASCDTLAAVLKGGNQPAEDCSAPMNIRWGGIAYGNNAVSWRDKRGGLVRHTNGRDHGRWAACGTKVTARGRL